MQGAIILFICYAIITLVLFCGQDITSSRMIQNLEIDNRKLKQEKTNLEADLDKYNVLYTEAIHKIKELEMENEMLYKFKSKDFQQFSCKDFSKSELLDVIKFAMKKSHPDNGGKQEDFIKYRKFYKRISE